MGLYLFVIASAHSYLACRAGSPLLQGTPRRSIFGRLDYTAVQRTCHPQRRRGIVRSRNRGEAARAAPRGIGLVSCQGLHYVAAMGCRFCGLGALAPVLACSLPVPERRSYCVQKPAQVCSDRQSAGSFGWRLLLGVTQTRPDQFSSSARLLLLHLANRPWPLLDLVLLLAKTAVLL
jgi:hypothetical protein